MEALSIALLALVIGIVALSKRPSHDQLISAVNRRMSRRPGWNR